MNNYAVQLKDGKHAIIQSCGFNKNNQITARIGIILPQTKCIEFLNLKGWDASYKGKSKRVNKKLISIYNKNKKAIRKNVMLFVG